MSAEKPTLANALDFAPQRGAEEDPTVRAQRIDLIKQAKEEIAAAIEQGGRYHWAVATATAAYDLLTDCGRNDPTMNGVARNGANKTVKAAEAKPAPTAADYSAEAKWEAARNEAAARFRGFAEDEEAA